MKVYVSINYNYPGDKYSSSVIIGVDTKGIKDTSGVFKHAYDDIFVPKLRELGLNPELVNINNWRYLGANVMLIE